MVGVDATGLLIVQFIYKVQILRVEDAQEVNEKRLPCPNFDFVQEVNHEHREWVEPERAQFINKCILCYIS